jgi:multisubunit Na+/H+ antiporter MnhE subunit
VFRKIDKSLTRIANFLVKHNFFFIGFFWGSICAIFMRDFFRGELHLPKVEVWWIVWLVIIAICTIVSSVLRYRRVNRLGIWKDVPRE